MVKRVVALVVSLAYASVAAVSRRLAKLFGRDSGSSLVVLTYHTVAPIDMASGIEVARKPVMFGIRRRIGTEATSSTEMTRYG